MSSDDEEGWARPAIRHVAPDPQSSVAARRRGSGGVAGWLRRLALGADIRRAVEREIVAAREAEDTPNAAGSSDASGYASYGVFIKDELDVQDKRKASFEQRGLAVITTSGTLVTLLFALAALSTKEAATFTLPGAAVTWLSVALVLFFVSALAALLSNAPFVYQAVPASSIKERLRERPVRDAAAAAKDIAFSRLDALESAKRLNGIKGLALTAAMSFEALAVGCVAVAVWIIL